MFNDAQLQRFRRAADSDETNGSDDMANGEPWKKHMYSNGNNK